MKAILKPQHLILVPESDNEQNALAAWKEPFADHVFHLGNTAGTGLALRNLGIKAEACREPLNVTSMSPDPRCQWISNYAPADFDLDGIHYASVEGFWQSLKFADPQERARVANLAGREAARAGHAVPYGDCVSYLGEQVPVGSPRHWKLMRRACLAKFTQHATARQALLETGTRPLIHRTKRDSRTIPGAIMAEIWMRIRHKLQNHAG